MASTACRREAPPGPDAAPPPAAGLEERPAVAPEPDPVAGLPAPAPRPASFRSGVSLGLFVSNPDPAYQRQIYGQLLDEIAATGAQDLQLVVQWAQTDVAAHDLAPDPALTPPDARLSFVMDQARARGLRVFLMPTVHLRRRAMGAWRGALAPADPEAWWAAYGRFIGHYAALARIHRADLFAVGSELSSLERHADRWRDLIAEVRAVFPGALTYSANWDHFERVPFWGALDLIGVTAYVQLSAAPDPGEEALVAGWRGFQRALAGVAAREGRPVLLTEVGFPAQASAAARPWDYRVTGPPDPALQTRCYRALYQAWQAWPGLAGLYAWNWFGVGGAADPGYALRQRGAEAVLRHWYLGLGGAR